MPAKRGARVTYTGTGKPQLGTIKGADGAHLIIKIDGAKCAGRFHPKWELRYLPDNAEITGLSGYRAGTNEGEK